MRARLRSRANRSSGARQERARTFRAGVKFRDRTACSFVSGHFARLLVRVR